LGALPLAGVRVLELSTYVTASLAGALLGDLGAEVIKVEAPGGGDPMRYWPDGYSAAYQAVNKSKRSIELDLKGPEDKAFFLRLVAESDVVVHNMRLAAAERLGVDAATLRAVKPSLVHCAITGFGSVGPRVGRPSYNQIGQSLSGLDSVLVDPEDPEAIGPALSDTATALMSAHGILAALYRRNTTGEGASIETNMLSSTLPLVASDLVRYLYTGEVDDRLQRARLSLACIARCADGKLLSVHLSTPQKFWLALLEVLGAPELADDPRFADHNHRVANYEAYRAAVVPRFLSRPRDEWLEELRAHDVPSAPVLAIDEVFADEQFRALDLEQREPGEQGRQIGYVASPWTIDGELLRGHRPPYFGEHSAAIRAELAASVEERS